MKFLLTRMINKRNSTRRGTKSCHNEKDEVYSKIINTPKVRCLRKSLNFGWLDFKITNRCNNRCTYCGVEQDPPTAQEKIPIEAIIQTNKAAMELGFTYFAFLGGEPSLRQNWNAIFKPFTEKRNNCHLLVITNMKHFNEELYRALFGSKAASAYLVASIDRLTMPNYKHQNSQQVLSDLWKIHDLTQAYTSDSHRNIQVHSVITRENFTEFPVLVEFFWKRHVSVSLAMVEPLKIVEGSPQNYNEFTTDELGHIIQHMRKLQQKNMLEFPNQILLEYLEQYQAGILQMRHCLAGKEHVIIESDGQVYPCLTESYRRGLGFGNIIHEKFGEIYGKLQGFTCHYPLADTCWDHYLWNRLGEHVWRG